MNEQFVEWLTTAPGKECVTHKPPNALAIAFEAGARSRQKEIDQLKIDMLAAAKRIAAQSDLLARCAEIDVTSDFNVVNMKQMFAATFSLTDEQLKLARDEAGVRDAIARVVLETFDCNWFREAKLS